MATPRVPQTDFGGGRPASGDSARAALVNPVSQAEATQRLRGSNIAAGFDGLAKLALGAAEMIKKQDIDRDQIMAVDLEGRLQRLNDEAINKLDPLAPDYSQQVKDILKQNADAVTADAQFRTREVQDETTRRFTRISAATELASVNARQKSIAGEAERVYKQRLDELYGAIRKDPDAADVHTQAFQADAARLRDGIPADRLRIIATAAADGMLAARVEGYAQKGQFGMARKFLDDNSGSFTPETNRQLRGVINGLEDKAQRNYALASTDAAARVRIEIIKQQDPDAPQTVTRERLDGMLKSGAIRPQDADNLYAALAATDRNRNIELDKNRLAIKNLNTPGAATGDDVDRGFRIYLGDAAQRRGDKNDRGDPLSSPDAPEVAAILAHQTGIVAPMYSRFIDTLASSGGPGSGEVEIANLAKAVTIYKGIKERAPDAKWTFEKNDRIDLVLAQAKANGGDVMQAARDVLKNLPKDQKEIMALTEAAREAARKIDFAAESRPILGDWLSRQLDTAGSAARTLGRVGTFSQLTEFVGGKPVIPKGEVAPEIPLALQIEFRQNFENHFRLSGGNAEVAKAAALEQIKGVWGVTRVGGDKTPYVMRHAPATFLSPDKSWFRDDLDKMMSTAAEKLLRTRGWAPPSDEIRKGAPAYILEADAITLREAAAKDPKAPPSYLLKVLREDRLYHTTGRIRMPTEEEMKTIPAVRDRTQQFEDRQSAREARELLERQTRDRADRRRKGQ